MGQGSGVDTADRQAARLRPPRHQVSRRAIAYWSVRAAIGWLLLAAVQAVPLVTADDHPTWLLTTFVITLVVGVAHVLVMPQWRFRVHRWEVTAEAVYTQAGWFNRGAAGGAGVADPDRRLRARALRAAVRHHQGDDHHRLRSRTSHDPRPRPGHRDAALVDELTSNTQATQEDGT